MPVIRPGAKTRAGLGTGSGWPDWGSCQIPRLVQPQWLATALHATRPQPWQSGFGQGVHGREPLTRLAKIGRANQLDPPSRRCGRLCRGGGAELLCASVGDDGTPLQ